MKSFQSEKPIQRDEFERSIDAAAANVKARGMNFHRKILWNALDHYVTANYDDLIKDNKKAWLIYWRDMNCIQSQVPRILKTRIDTCFKQVNSLPNEQIALRNVGITLIKSINEQYLQQVSGQRLLLELLTRTSELLTFKQASKESIQSYKNLAKELQLNYPTLHIIGGLAEAFLGILLYLPSFSYSASLINHGIATAKTGFFAPQRTKLCKDILDFSTVHEMGLLPNNSN
jgi:hypothetical protein